jgi:predicted PurR-regulated permease PerM
LQRRLKIRHGLALALFVFVAFGVVALLVWMLGPKVVEQFAALETELPRAARSLLIQLQSHQWGLWILQQSPGTEQIASGFTFAITRIGGIVVSSVTLLIGLFIVFSLSIYFTAEPGIYYNGLRHLVPEEYHKKLDACAASVVDILRWWVLAKLLSMTMVGVLVSVGLAIVGVPLAGTLGLIAAALTFIPNLGPLISMIPAFLLALAESPTKGLLTLLVFSIVYTLEGYVVTPLLERNIVRLPPALTLTMQLLLAVVAGPVGVALAAPLAAAGIGIFSVLLPHTTEVAVPVVETAQRVE